MKKSVIISLVVEPAQRNICEKQSELVFQHYVNARFLSCRSIEFHGLCICTIVVKK